MTSREFATIYDVFKPAARAAGFRLMHRPQRGQHVLRLLRTRRRK